MNRCKRCGGAWELPGPPVAGMLCEPCGNGEPLIFETLVFRNDKDTVDMKRYSTEDEARDGHAAFVAQFVGLSGDEPQEVNSGGAL